MRSNYLGPTVEHLRTLCPADPYPECSLTAAGSARQHGHVAGVLEGPGERQPVQVRVAGGQQLLQVGQRPGQVREGEEAQGLHRPYQVSYAVYLSRNRAGDLLPPCFVRQLAFALLWPESRFTPAEIRT